MSYTYNSKPTSLGSTRARGAASNRGRTTTKPRETLQQRQRQTSPQRNPPRVPAAGRGYSRRMDQGETSAQNHRAAGREGGENQSGGMEQRFQFRDSYTVISPNEKKRAEISKQAAAETRKYEEFKEKNRIGYISLPPQTVGGGEVTQRDVRQQQSLQNSQRNKFGAKATYKSTIRRQEEEEAREKKARARLQTEKNKDKDKDRQQRLDQDRRQKNDQFLRRFEKQGKQKRTTVAAAAVPSRDAAACGYDDQERYQDDYGPEGDFEEDAIYDEEQTFDPAIEQLRDMFPHKSMYEITEALNAAHGSMDRAVDFLMG